MMLVMITEIIATVVYFILIGFMLYSVKIQDAKMGVIIKVLLGLLFTAPVLIFGFNHSSVSFIMPAALILCLAGDVLLGLFRYTSGEKWNYYSAGVIAFAAAQVMYLLHTVELGRFFIIVPVIAAVGSIGFVLMNKKFIKTAPAWISIAYSFVILMVLFNSILIVILGPYSHQMLLFAVGMIFFFISDYFLFYVVFDRENYKERMDYVNKSTYYIAQFLIMASVVFL